ncbi:flagellar protein FlgN [Caldinitratiruptor microaerophilus]|uniref:FlgN protein n=1 Tax=Caldinitratiruptor microaerophilus TaxID=671077 RepID=A0AA35G941_9FIRM|nr:flagellar protein FlgN [Caldinitratiruptor microaerophilus]BDG61745.1 hypothetical protein caldi_28350 [Caldinitratiruptor microaerophilus]
MPAETSTHVRELMEAMEAQLSILDDLLAIQRKKTDVLVAGRADELEVLVRGEQVLIWRLARAEERRQHLQEALAGALGIPPQELTLRRLVEEAGADLRQPLEAIQDRYARTVTELQKCNSLNHDLIQNALAYVDFALSLLQGPPPQGDTYTPDGRRRSAVVRPSVRRPRLDGRT